MAEMAKTTTRFVTGCLVRGAHRFRAWPARAAATKVDGIPVISQKKCLDCKVTRSVLENNTVRYWWTQKDERRRL